MTRAWLLPIVVALAGCPNNPGPSDGGLNPPQLWLAPNGSELFVRLVPVEPPEF